MFHFNLTMTCNVVRWIYASGIKTSDAESGLLMLRGSMCHLYMYLFWALFDMIMSNSVERNESGCLIGAVCLSKCLIFIVIFLLFIYGYFLCIYAN